MANSRNRPEPLDPYRRSLHTSARNRRKTIRRRRLALLGAVLVIVAVVVVALLAWGGDNSGVASGGSVTQPGSSSSLQGTSGSSASGGSSDVKDSTTTTEAGVTMDVRATAETSPSAFNLSTAVFRDTTKVTAFSRSVPLSLGAGKDYTSLPGVVTFRGNNYREGASYGSVDVKLGQLEILWTATTGSLAKSGGSGSWTGSGWTGQPLIVKWPEALKKVMNISAEKKADSDLVEVIYPCLDGNIYFLDLKDGTKTRKTIVSGGGPFKGTGSIYPDGTPILFVGHGDNSPDKEVVRARLYSLVDQSQLYTFGKKPDPNALRKFHAYDSSALFDVDTGTIIEPGENGLLYTIELNPQFDQQTGTLTLDPESPVKMRYTAPNYSDAADNTPDTRWWGMEDSAVIWHNYLYVAENGGKLMCIDLNTMTPVWVQDVLDDTNTTPVFEEVPEDNTCYLYISTSLHITDKASSNGRVGNIPIWKINAATGEIVWESTPYKCYTVSGVSGGVQGTPVLGQHDIANLVIYPVARTPDVNSGVLVALDKETGKEVWKTSMPNYAWSSPVAIYTPEGKSYIVQCDSVGKVFLLEGSTGTVLYTLDLGTNIEASPAAFGNTIVVGTRGQKIFGIEVK